MNRRRFIRLFNKSGVGDSCIAPANTVAPVVSGDLQKGDTLTTTNGTWTGTAPLIYTYQWKRNGVSIPAAVSNTHVIVDADLGQDIQCQVTANSPCGASPLSVLSNTVVPEYNTLAADYFARVIANGDNSLTLIQKAAINNKFIALALAGLNNTNVDRLFADKYCYTEVQALTAWLWNGIGSDFATAVNSPTFTAGIGWTHTGTSYINPNYIASADSSNFTLGDAGWYHSIDSIDNGVTETCCGGCSDGFSPRFELRALDRFGGVLYWSINSSIYSNFATAASFSNYQLKFDGATFSIKTDVTTNTAPLTVANHLPAISMLRGAFNNIGSVISFIQSGAEDRWLCIADSSFDKDIIETSLAT